VLWISDRIKQQFAPRPGVTEPVVTEEEIKEWIDVGEVEGDHRGRRAGDALFSVGASATRRSARVMTPRVDVVMIEDTSTLENALSIFNETGFFPDPGLSRADR